MSPYTRRQRRRARKGHWQAEFLHAYGPHGVPLGNVTPRVKREIMRAIARGCYVTSTTGGTHATGSYHYQVVAYLHDGERRTGGRAADVAGGWVAMRRFYADVKRRERKRGTQFAEAFGPGNWYIKDGQTHAGQFPGHTDHVHVAPYRIV